MTTDDQAAVPALLDRAADGPRHARDDRRGHRAARKEVGKSDGSSNPLIAMGAEIRPQLAALQARLDVASKIPGSFESPQ